MKAFKGNIVLKNKILQNGFVVIEGDKITYVGDKYDGEYTDLKDKYIAPGFIDIHCHASIDCMCFDNPKKVADYHKKHGTTSMLLTFYRDVPHEKVISCLNQIKDMIKKGDTNVVGAHLEGPYLSSKYGTGLGCAQLKPDKKIYREYIKSGVIKQWTSAPEVEGVIDLIKELSKNGIVPSIGHSEASYDQVKKAYDAGARITTHIFDATGITKDENSFVGTEDVNFDEACMLMDDMYYEVICDCNWVHVRKEKLALLIKTVGIDKVVAITDSYFSNGLKEYKDINVDIVNGQISLSGSKLTMDVVAKNLNSFGLSLPDIFKLTSYNPAKAIRLLDRGEIKKGKKAHLILVDKNCNYIKTL